MDKIRLGIVGLNFGAYLLNSLRQPPISDVLEIVAVCDQDRARSDRVAAKHGLRGFYDLNALLAEPDIEAVGLFTNPAGRAGLLGRIIRAGKHVMTTKPFELDPAAARAVLDEAARLGRVIHLNSPPPLPGEAIRTIRAWIQECDLGRPVAARAEVWTAKRDRADGSWLDDPARCPVAPVTRVGIYKINTLVRLFGKAEAVQAIHTRLFTGRPTPDNAQLGIRFANGAVAAVFASFGVGDGQGFREALTLNYERGTFYWDVGCMGPDANLMLRTVGPDGQPVVRTAKVPDDAHGYQWEAFRRAIRDSAPPDPALTEEVLEGVKILAAMARSEPSGRLEPVG
jgi:predicted dehydrogenase